MQCGGRGGDCYQRGACMDGPFAGTACAGGGSCERQSEWYWQCIPRSQQQYASSPWNGACSSQVRQCRGASAYACAGYWKGAALLIPC
jgi:hypothetical protein